MQNVFKLIKLEFKLDRKTDKKSKNAANFWLSFFFSFLVAVFLSVGIVGCLTLFSGEKNALGELSFIVLAIMVVLFSYSLSILLKSMFLFKQKEILAYLPIDKKEIYLAKLCACFIKTAILNFAVSLPSFAAFGIINGEGLYYYFTSIAFILFLPIIPFGLAGIISVPFTYICNFLKNKPILRLFAVIAVVLAVLYFYTALLFDLANIWLLKDSSSDNLISSVVNFCANGFLPSSWVSCTLLKQNAAINVLLFASCIIAVSAISLVLGIFTYESVFNNTLTEKNLAKTIKTKTKAKNVFSAYFCFEIKDLFRKPGLLFTYVGMAVIMPFMVYFCDKFIIRFAVEKMGSTIVVGVTLLVVLIFVSIICSPSASLISKEGDGFWILKTNPNGIGLPLLAKALVTVCFCGGSLLVTMGVVCAFGMIEVAAGAQIFCIALIYVVALISFGLLLNLARPNVFYAEKENVSNVSAHLCTGLICSLVISVFAIIESFSFSVQTVLLYCLAAVGVIAAVCVALLILLNKRLYAKMEV